jgi:hypothetical protein
MTTKIKHNQIYYAPLNIMDFGAVGNGTTDDSAAMTAALAALPANGGTIVIPAGVNIYLDTTSYTFTIPNIVIQGEGENSKITSNVTSGAFVFTTKPGSGTKFINFALYLKSATGGGISFQEARENSICDGLYIMGASNGDVPLAGSVGIYSSKTSFYSGYLRVQNCYLTQLLTGVWLDNTATVTTVTNNSFVGKQAPLTAGSAAIRIGNDGGNYLISGNEIEGWERGIHITGSQGFTIVGNNYESNAVDLAAGAVIADLEITRQAGAATIVAYIAGNFHVNAGSNIGNVLNSILPTDQVVEIDQNQWQAGSGPAYAQARAYTMRNRFNSIGQQAANGITVPPNKTMRAYLGEFAGNAASVVKIAVAITNMTDGSFAYAEYLYGGNLGLSGQYSGTSVASATSAGTSTVNNFTAGSNRITVDGVNSNATQNSYMTVLITSASGNADIPVISFVQQ